MGYAHYYIVQKEFSEEQRYIIAKEINSFLTAVGKSYPLRSYSSGGYYKDYSVEFSVIELDMNRIHIEPHPMNAYTWHLGNPIIIDLENPPIKSKQLINTYRLPFDFIVQGVFIIIQNIAPECFEYTSDGTVEDWRWSMIRLNTLMGTKYSLAYLNGKNQDEQRRSALSEVLNVDSFMYVDGKRFINDEGIIYEVLTDKELYTACVNHIADTCPVYLLEHFSMDGFYTDMIKRMYEKSGVPLSPVGIGFVTEIDGTEYFVLQK